jgi:hypothetical protein
MRSLTVVERAPVDDDRSRNSYPVGLDGADTRMLVQQQEGLGCQTLLDIPGNLARTATVSRGCANTTLLLAAVQASR